MKNIVGTPARKESFYQRDREIQKIVERIKAGNNIQIAAPRRVGKTSILFYLLDNKVEKDVYVYVDTEAIDNEQDFFKKLLKEILKVEEIAGSNILKKIFEAGGKFFKRIKSINPFDGGIEFHEPNDHTDYKEEVENFLSGMALEDNRILTLLIL